ncbi:MAG: hypothetical protein ACYC5Q_05685 [Thermoleophilia bacterium]
MTEFQGTIYLVTTLPLPWPHTQDVVLESTAVGDYSCAIFATADGRLEARISRESGETRSIVSRPIEILSGQGVVFLSVVWARDRGDIGVGQGDDIVNLVGDDGAVQITTGWRNEDPGLIKAWEVPAAREKCKAKMKWRTEFFRPREIPGKVKRDQADQVVDLCDSLCAIEHLVEQIGTGSRFLIPDLAARLRGLLYWRGKKPGKYDPLLLRLAAMADLPLPVFASIHSLEDDEGCPEGWAYHRLGPFVRIVGSRSGDGLIDLQDWLEHTLVHDVGDLGTEKGGRAMTPLRLIGESANHQGTSHFSQWTTADLHLLGQQEHLSWDAVSVWLLTMAEVAHALGDYVLRNICQSAAPPCPTGVCSRFEPESAG